MEFSGANSANIPSNSHPSKKKQPYIRPQATVLTPDQAQEQVRAKAAPQSHEFEACSELIAEARKRQEHGRDSVSPGEDKLDRADVA
jgi:hypothetical protein